MLEVQNVTFHYNTQEVSTPPALRNINLLIQPGETVAIIGHNGSGKSTLTRLLAAILHPTQGEVRVDDISTTARGEDLWTIRQRVGVIFQNPDDQLVANTVIDDIAFGPENLGLPRHEIEERVQEALSSLELGASAQLPISDLSVGQKQQVAIAGVLAMRPRYLLLDEPTTMLPGHLVRSLLATEQRLARERGMAVIHITHFMHEVTAFQRVLVMHQGEILLDGSPSEIFSHADQLETLGLDVPMVTRLGERLRARGWQHLSDVILTPEQLKADLCSSNSSN
ncbi:energy-coupling factor transporter ATP-binding protein EcfA1 [Ktedonobacter sp. SOSP1-52]|uniref:ATP-binding cassette domain-containing protein n=1 Tax=Ktedonobacter sp. SOSP1-52 TaxID=2778366 RepID=UPI0019151280|nr:ATP-binding cassette domain-containing protein [Ktedonobacter sp. SOSP1-52]GHO67077.1 energy-coupling factor transporter ATP-binding protein EcfA1 [Ktedonobacter sp. SOSP1-52]